MKLKALFIITFVIMNSTSFSQLRATERNRYIEVTGSAEINIKPDEIEIEFTLKEYYKKGTKEKFNLSSAEQEFYSILSKYGLKEKDIILENSNLYWSNWYSMWSSRREDLKFKKVTIKIDSSINLLSFIKDLSKDWLDDISISMMKNKNELNFRKEVKIQAIKAAKDKANYLLSALGEEIGKVISVEEVNDNYWYPKSASLSNTNVALNSNDPSAEINNTSLIKLKYEIKVAFEIK